MLVARADDGGRLGQHGPHVLPAASAGGAGPVSAQPQAFVASSKVWGAVAKSKGAPPAMRLLADEAASSRGEDVNVQCHVYIPVLVNKQALQQGEKLKALCGVAPPKRPDAPIAVSQVAKRAKIE